MDISFSRMLGPILPRLVGRKSTSWFLKKYLVRTTLMVVPWPKTMKAFTVMQEYLLLQHRPSQFQYQLRKGLTWVANEQSKVKGLKNIPTI